MDKVADRDLVKYWKQMENWRIRVLECMDLELHDRLYLANWKSYHIPTGKFFERKEYFASLEHYLENIARYNRLGKNSDWLYIAE